MCNDRVGMEEGCSFVPSMNDEAKIDKLIRQMDCRYAIFRIIEKRMPAV
jgi:hypothetical protein